MGRVFGIGGGRPLDKPVVIPVVMARIRGPDGALLLSRELGRAGDWIFFTRRWLPRLRGHWPLSWSRRRRTRVLSALSRRRALPLTLGPERAGEMLRALVVLEPDRSFRLVPRGSLTYASLVGALTAAGDSGTVEIFETALAKEDLSGLSTDELHQRLVETSLQT